MDVLAAVLSGFALAILAPAVHRVAGKATGWLLALHPAALVAYFAWLAPAIWRDGPRVVRVEWAPALGLDLTFRLDGFSILFFILISGLGAIILIYGGGYLEKSPRLPRFYPLLLFFMASMLGVVVADNLVLIYIFWELTSVSSYLLIGFEYERESARAAALKALLVTATGGVLMLGGFVILGIIGGSFELSVLFQQEDFIRNHELYTFATLLVIAGAFTKSAQFPFQFWLPAAMEAPTPVSAYLHAATMVKAGVYLLARLNPLLGGTDLWAGCLITAGLITLLFGALLSLYGTDLKQVLAFLTVSVLGVLTFLIGLGTEIAVKAMVIYLTAHALYKGALFLVAGAVDHETGTRDIRDLGGLRGKLPITAAAGAMAAIALAGLPPMYGFIAKEMLYEAGTHAPFLAALFTSALVLSAMFYFAAAGIVGYSPFFGTKKETPKHPHEAPPSMWLGPLVLASAGLVLGIFPTLMDAPLQSAAAAIAPGRDVAFDLHLFHGITPELLLSIASALGGFLLFMAYWRLGAYRRFLESMFRLGPSRGYDLLLKGMLRFATWQTDTLQNGYLRYYLLTIMMVMGTLTLAAIYRAGEFPMVSGMTDIQVHEALLGLVILAGVVSTVRSRSRLAAVASLGVVGMGIAIVFSLFGAPDLAMTQFIVEVLTVILLVLVIHHLPEYSTLSTRTGRYRDAVVSIAVGGIMMSLVLAMNAIEPPEGALAVYYVENAYTLAFGRNIVNVILTDFRVLDTLGEIIVVAVAALGVYALLRLRLPEEGH